MQLTNYEHRIIIKLVDLRESNNSICHSLTIQWNDVISNKVLSHGGIGFDHSLKLHKIQHAY